MGETTKKSTTRIFTSLLAIGCLEKSNALTRNKLMEKLDHFNVRENEQARRLIDLIKNWVNVGDNNLLQALGEGREKQYQINFEDLPKDIYLDFLDTFLSLHAIGNRPIDNSIIELDQKVGSRPLSILTDLVIAIEEGSALMLKYDDEDLLYFKPIKVLKNGNKWCVEGECNHPRFPETTVLEISKILEIH
jgi:hypothetical protein